MVLVSVALVRIVDVPRLIPMMLVSITLMFIVLMIISVVLVSVALVRIVDVPRFIPVMLVGIALVRIVRIH